MRKNFLPPVLTVLGGAVGFALRKWQLSSGFESDTGLAIPGAPAAAALLAWSALLALVILLLSWKNKERLPWDRAFSTGQHNTLFITALLLSAAMLLFSAGSEIVTRSINVSFLYVGENRIARAASAVIPPLRILLCALGLPCVFLWGRVLYTGGGQGKESLCLLEPCLLFCVWLISNYQVWAADPVVMNYLFEVLAIVFSLLGLYFISSYSFQIGKPRRTTFFCLTGAYFSMVSLADGLSIADLTRHGFAILFLIAHAALILNQPAGEAPAEAKTEATDNG